MEIITQKDGKKYVKIDDHTIALEWLRGGWDKLTINQFKALLSGGMMWEFYPDAPERWPL